MTFEVVVVGAGGGGAVLGLALARKGIPVLVLERQGGPPTELRAETIQPNGQEILSRLGILQALPADAVEAVQRFHFLTTRGKHLFSADYGLLPPPWNRALVTLSNVAHAFLLERLAAQPAAELWFEAEFQGIARRDGRITSVLVRRGGQRDSAEIDARLVVGADGAFSIVRRALGITAKVHRYPHGYLIALLARPEGMQGEARYYMGRGELLGLFPAPGNRVVTLYMVETEGLAVLKARGLKAFKARVAAIDPALSGPLDSLVTWEQVGFLPCARVRADRWVTDGGAVIGDAAHAMNPHVSQGRMQAMADAMALADVVETCHNSGDWSARMLSGYESVRRPQVEMLQRLADEQTLFWNAADPVRVFLRNRVFRGLDRNPRLRYQALTATAGLRTTPPLTWVDKLIAVGLLPDRHANEIQSV